MTSAVIPKAAGRIVGAKNMWRVAVDGVQLRESQALVIETAEQAIVIPVHEPTEYVLPEPKEIWVVATKPNGDHVKLKRIANERVVAWNNDVTLIINEGRA